MFCELEIDSLVTGRAEIRARHCASRPGLKRRGDAVREDQKCPPLDGIVITESSTPSKVCIQSKKPKANDPGPHVICTSGKESQVKTPVMSAGCTQTKELGTGLSVSPLSGPPPPVSEHSVIVQGPVLEHKISMIKVLQKELFSNCMVQRPDSVVKIIGKTV